MDIGPHANCPIMQSHNMKGCPVSLGGRSSFIKSLCRARIPVWHEYPVAWRLLASVGLLYGTVETSLAASCEEVKVSTVVMQDLKDQPTKLADGKFKPDRMLA